MCVCVCVCVCVDMSLSALARALPSLMSGRLLACWGSTEQVGAAGERSVMESIRTGSMSLQTR